MKIRIKLNKKIGEWEIDKKTGKILSATKDFDIWAGTHVKVEKLFEDEEPIISFNVRENKRIGKNPVWFKPDFKVIEIN